MDVSAEEYLRLTSQLQRKYFSRGYSSTSSCKPGSNAQCTSSASGPSSTPQSSMRLPMKKRKRRDDDDDDDSQHVTEEKEKEKPVPVPLLPPESLAKDSTEASTDVNPQNVTKKISLLDKWFPGSTLNSATLDSAQAPRLETVDITVTRMKVARERLLALRMAVEDVLRSAHLSTDENLDGVENTSEWDWAEMRAALSQFSTTNTFRRKNHIKQAVHWLFAAKPQDAVMKTPFQREWDAYLSKHGPENGVTPSLSLLVWLDSACTTALFSAVVTRLMRGYKRGLHPPQQNTTHAAKLLVCDNTDETLSGGEDETCEEEEEEEENEESSVVLNNTTPLDLYTCLPSLHAEGLDDDISSLLWFLRYFMPVDVKDRSGNAIVRTSGYGVWLYACLSAVDTPLDPDLDRLVHELFRTCCRQIRCIGEAFGVRGDDRGAILQTLPPRRDFEPMQYNTINDIRRDDVLALHTIIIVLTKLFRQNQNRLIPL